MSLNSSNAPVAETKPPAPKWDWRRVGIIAGLVAWTFFAFILAQAIGLAAIRSLEWAGVPLSEINPAVFTTVANALIYGLAIVLIIGVPWWVKKRRTSIVDIGLQRLPRWMDFVWLLAGVFVYLILTALVTGAAMVLFPQNNYTEAQDVGFTSLANHWEFILAFVSLVIVAPVAEEVIFRGYLFGKLRKYASVVISVILTSLLFAIAHFQWNVGLDTFALGVVLALLRVVSGSIWASILLHMLKNGVAFYFLFVNPLVL